MSQNTCIFSSGLTATPTSMLPSFPSREAVEAHIKNTARAWKDYAALLVFMQQELLNFCTGKQGLRITYDTVFRKIFDPGNINGFQRLQSLLSAILGRSVKIIKIMPREGTQMSESASFVVMDVLVQLDDFSFANVEMQKIGYNFPLARVDCYVSDIIMRQYVDIKASLGKKFSFSDLHKVYSIILMEQSPDEFHKAPGEYIHIRKPSFNTGIYSNTPGLHEDIFICLDSFHSIVHNITKSSSNLEAWMTFLSSTDLETIGALIKAFPCFASLYQEVANFAKDPKELIDMLSEELYIMDKNMERLMVAELQEKVAVAEAKVDVVETERDRAVAERNQALTERNHAVAERDQAVAEREQARIERNIYKLCRIDKSPEEIAQELQLSAEYVNSVLGRG